MRHRIIMAAIEEINLHGFKFTMSHLTKRLSISKSSLYEHFTSKNELIAAILDLVVADMQAQEDAIYQNKALNNKEKFKAVLAVTPKTLGPLNNKVNEDLRTACPIEWQRIRDFNQQRLNRIVSLLLDDMEVGAIRSVNIPVLKELIVAGMNALSGYRFLTENNITYADAVHAMADLLTYGLIPSQDL